MNELAYSFIITIYRELTESQVSGISLTSIQIAPTDEDDLDELVWD